MGAQILHLVERTDKAITADDLSDLTESVGWGRRTQEKWDQILTCSTFVCSLWDGTRLVGFGRIVEDGTMAMFYDIAVHPDYQAKGAGSRIMRNLLERIAGKDFASVGLFAWAGNPGARHFYEKHGFENVSFGMKLSREKDPPS